jgi:predicted RNA binding protein YcfA (HicA-like mRNA interferase family)
MSKLPSILGKECVKALEKIGFYQKRRESSHIILRRDDPFAQVVVPDHDEIAKGTLRAIIRDIDLTMEEFITLIG